MPGTVILHIGERHPSCGGNVRALLTQTPATSGARSPQGFFGWHMVAASALALMMTAPGQTTAVSAFIDPMISDLGISRTAVSAAYLIGTLIGATALPFVGHAIDVHGTRRSMIVVAALFGSVLVLLSLVQGLAGLVIGFVGIRMLGQGALSLCATTAVARWFVHRRGRALAIVSATGAAGISFAPVLLERLISATSWRTAWLVEGLAVWLVVIPLAVLVVRDDPSRLGQLPDGRPPTGEDQHATEWGRSRSEAMRAPFFWVLVAAVCVSGLLSTAVAFHQISLLGERGLSASQAAANFIPHTVAGIVATLVTGSLADRVHPRILLVSSMALLSGGLVAGTVVRPGWSAVGFGMAIGAASASIRALEAAAVPRFFGVRHIGGIRGVVVAVSVGSTAFGPFLFAVVFEATGSYGSVLSGSAVAPALVVVAALVTPVPPVPLQRRDDGTRGATSG